MEEILEFHLSSGLDSYYKYKIQGGEKFTVYTLLICIRPFIEAYQKKFNDYHGNNLKLCYIDLPTTYSYASNIIHSNGFPDNFSPKKLKHDLKKLAKKVLGASKYKDIKNNSKSKYQSILDVSS